ITAKTSFPPSCNLHDHLHVPFSLFFILHSPLPLLIPSTALRREQLLLSLSLSRLRSAEVKSRSGSGSASAAQFTESKIALAAAAALGSPARDTSPSPDVARSAATREQASPEKARETEEHLPFSPLPPPRRPNVVERPLAPKEPVMRSVQPYDRDRDHDQDRDQDRQWARDRYDRDRDRDRKGGRMARLYDNRNGNRKLKNKLAVQSVVEVKRDPNVVYKGEHGENLRAPCNDETLQMCNTGDAFGPEDEKANKETGGKIPESGSEQSGPDPGSNPGSDAEPKEDKYKGKERDRKKKKRSDQKRKNRSKDKRKKTSRKNRTTSSSESDEEEDRRRKRSDRDGSRDGDRRRDGQRKNEEQSDPDALAMKIAANKEHSLSNSEKSKRGKKSSKRSKGRGSGRRNTTKSTTKSVKEKVKSILPDHVDLDFWHGMLPNEDTANLLTVSDFGLTRKSRYYRVDTEKPMNLRWISPEVFDTATVDRIFVVPYDVPYSRWDADEVFMKVVEQGYRISPPYTAPKDIANLMKECLIEPKLRPTFKMIHVFLLAQAKIMERNPKMNEDMGVDGPSRDEKKKKKPK
ncbi:hypothetical protein PRIPAC_83427, partial [Pristionchus pacificus]|uniref:Tyrosine kinase n=1 Tax=Pristionchus pacificus TaxID=54126 RepID=A0A2A6BLW0_PRIPA